MPVFTVVAPRSTPIANLGFMYREINEKRGEVQEEKRCKLVQKKIVIPSDFKTESRTKLCLDARLKSAGMTRSFSIGF